MKYFADSALTAEDLHRRSMWWAAWMVRCYKMLAHELLGKTMFWDLCVKNCHLSSHWMTCLSLILCVALHSLPVGGKVWHLQVQTRVSQQFHLWIQPGGWKRMPCCSGVDVASSACAHSFQQHALKIARSFIPAIRSFHWPGKGSNLEAWSAGSGTGLFPNLSQYVRSTTRWFLIRAYHSKLLAL